MDNGWSYGYEAHGLVRYNFSWPPLAIANESSGFEPDPFCQTESRSGLDPTIPLCQNKGGNALRSWD